LGIIHFLPHKAAWHFSSPGKIKAFKLCRTRGV